MAATPAGTSRTLRRPDTDPFSDEDEPSVWEMAFTPEDAAGAEAPTDAPPATEAAPAEETAEQPESSVAPADLDAKPAPAKKERARDAWRAHRWSMVAAVVVVALLAGVVVFAVQWFGHRTQDAQRNAASAAARQMAVNLTSLNYNQIDGQMKQIIDQTTGDFRNQFTQSADPFSNVVRVAKVETTSEVVASGVQSFGDGKAHVLVAVRSTVKNAESSQPQVRNYRMALDLQEQAGQWLTSNVEFVP